MAVADACGADTRANDLFTELLDGQSIDIPDIDLDDFAIPTIDLATIDPLTNADLTTGVVGGTGTFDVLMASAKAHLAEQFEKGRITGAEYTKAYIAITESALSNATQFLLQRDLAYWQAQNAQIAAMTARVAMAVARVQYKTVQAQSMNAEAEYALTKMKLSTESIQFCAAKFTLEQMLPEQKKLIQEQAEAQRAQTLDTRSDGTTPVTGSVGKQKDLYTQQISSYQRDSEVKAAKLFTDAWITMKTMDEGLLPPTNFENANLNTILATIKTTNGL